MGIKTVKDKETGKVFSGQFSKKLPREIQQRALQRLRQLDQAGSLKDLHLPTSMQLEALKRNRKGQHSIRINNQWRVCFIWSDGDAYNVEITDYH